MALTVAGVALLIGILCTLFTAGFIDEFFSFSLDYESAEKKFNKNKEAFNKVCNYFTESDYENIYIHSSMKKDIMTANGEDVEIKDKSISSAISDLKLVGCKVIAKNNNTIHFQMWSYLDGGRGIAFSINGSEPELDYLTCLKKTSEENWYYYEEDFNLWEKNNTTNGIPNELLGTWYIRDAKVHQAGAPVSDYPLEDLYGEDIYENKVKLTFNSDGTFSRYIGTTSDKCEGRYDLSYGNKIVLAYRNGEQANVENLSSDGELLYYTHDADMTPIIEYYTKSDA